MPTLAENYRELGEIEVGMNKRTTTTTPKKKKKKNSLSNPALPLCPHMFKQCQKEHTGALAQDNNSVLVHEQEKH